VGKRVFWPGAQPTFSGTFDLLEIGHDVVFGSKGLMLCTTVDSCEKIILCAGSNVADSTVVLPGSIVGKNAVLGSNAVCPQNRYLPEESVWFGAKNGEPVRLEKGLHDSDAPINSADVKASSLQMIGDDTTIRPFGKAAYKGEANYFVLPIPMIIAYTVGVQIFVAFFTTAPILGALHLSAGYFFGWDVIARSYNNVPITTAKFFGVVLMFLCLTNLIRLIIWVCIEVSTKWFFIGQRQEGVFNWDTSTYPQQWELYRLLLPIRAAGKMSILDFICGSPYIGKIFGLLGCQMGKDCCLYPTGADPYMIESDLITMGDRCVIDDAKVVCHLNTRGNFELARIKLADNVTIRTEARVQCGVIFEEGSMLLEKSLAMTGEIIEPESVWLGAPATRLFSYDTVSSINSRSSADLV
jgi:carbonic anhydrase/acetyltransferase-like protein (isoleucine patch superfamily)